MLLTLGDLVEDVVVRLAGPVLVAGDTEARISRRRGGSAANTAAVAAGLGRRTRFVGQVGDDPLGGALVDALGATGVDVSGVRRAGTTGTIVVLVDGDGERTMLTDRAAASELTDPDPAWLDGVTVLHVPYYSLATEPLAATTRTVIGWAHDAGIRVSIDVSSIAIIDALGPDAMRAELAELAPAVVLANADESDALAIDGPLAGATTVVKRGPDPVTVHTATGSVTIDVPPLEGVGDTTGAGDAFAAGFLTADPADPEAAAHAGCAAAARHLLGRRH